MPEVWRSRSRTVMGRVGGTRSIVLVPSSAFFSTPTFIFAKEAMYFETGSSSLILPSSISCIATTEVITLVSEDRRKIVWLVIDRLAALLDQDVRAGDLPGRHLVVEELRYLRKLVLVETCPCGNIERA